MTEWEKKIVDAFISHYFASSAEIIDDRSILRLRSSTFFPDFDTAHPDERDSYLEAAESLERKGIVKLKWEKKAEKLKTLSCEDFKRLFEISGRTFPETEAEEIREMLGAILINLSEKESRRGAKAQRKSGNDEKIIALLKFLSCNFSQRDIGLGVNQHVMKDFIKLLEFFSEPVQQENITTRALSIQLYRDSKRLEELLTFCNPLFSRAKKTIPLPDFSFLERSYPETMISGKIIIEYKNEKIPLVNAGGRMLGVPMGNAEEMDKIRLFTDASDGQGSKIESSRTVLTIENKETFYALASPQKQGETNRLSRYDCFLYIGGYSNRAASALVKVLASSGFSFYHAGDLDPDGILILQHIQDLAEKPVIPVRMDAETFDQYRSWGRTLAKPMLHQIKKIKEETKAIPGMADLLRRIEETGLGVEQEIVDYR